MKRQARNGKYPHTRVGQTIRFTPAHIREILRLGEQRPQAQLAARAPKRKRAAASEAPALKAKTPPRKRKAA
jgi:hypothetical protein